MLELTMTEPRMPLEVANILKTNVVAIRVEMLDLVSEGELEHKQVGKWHVFWMKEKKRKRPPTRNDG